MFLQGVGDEEQFLLEAEGAGMRDALDEEAAWVVERRQPLGKRARRGVVERPGGNYVEPSRCARALPQHGGRQAVSPPTRFLPFPC